MDTHSLISLLENVGLNHHEAAVYMSLLEHGTKPALFIARTSNTPRTTIRSILDKLARQGIVDKLYRGSTQYYSCLPPEALIRFIERDITEKMARKKALLEAVPLFHSLMGTNDLVPKVRYFEGEQGIMEAFNHSLISGAKEILFFTSYDFFQTKKVRDYDVGTYLPSRIRRNIRMRVLGAKNKESLLWSKRKNELREHRFLPPAYGFPGNFFIYENFVLYYSANDGEYIAVLTESAVMAQTMRMLFECLWNTK
jgi:sugar-specific transcriptional regulator TrmB